MGAVFVLGFALVTMFCDCNSETTSLLNTAVKVGENVTMYCSSSDEMLWLLYNPDKKIMSGAKAEFPRHFLTSDSSNPNLRALSIISIQLTDAGHYKCVEREALSSSSAELLVLDADPRCDVTPSSNRRGYIEGDELMLECKVIYSGGWAPSARWQHVDSNGEILSEKTTTFATSPKFAHEELLRFTLSVNATTKLKGTKYRCTIYFDISQKPNTTTADNIPDYNFTWTSDVLSVSDLAPTGGNSDDDNDKTWIYALVGATVGCVLLLIINIVIIVACHAKTSKGKVKPEKTPSLTPDVLQSNSSLSGTVYNELAEMGLSQTRIADEQLQTTVITDAHLGQDPPTYAELASSQNRELSRPSLNDGNIARNNAVYASIDHTIRSKPDRSRSSSRAKFGSRR